MRPPADRTGRGCGSSAGCRVRRGRRAAQAAGAGQLARRHVAPWVLLGVLLAAWEVAGLAWGNDAAHPTLSLLLDPVLDTYPGRLGGWLVWLGAGRWLVTR